VTVETRQFAVKDILTELVEKEQGMAAALMDFCTSDDEIDDERLACTGRVCQILDALHTSTVVIATASKRKAKAPAGGSSTNHHPPWAANLQPGARVDGGGADGVPAEPGAQRCRYFSARPRRRSCSPRTSRRDRASFRDTL
jgi:hypothetical protein